LKWEKRYNSIEAYYHVHIRYTYNTEEKLFSLLAMALKIKVTEKKSKNFEKKAIKISFFPTLIVVEF